MDYEKLYKAYYLQVQRSLSASRIRGTIFFTNRCNFWKNRIMGESYLSSCKAKNSRKDG